MRFHIIIPARLHSTRLPNKVLADIGGKTMLQRVYEQALASEASSVTIATDHPDIYATAGDFAAPVVMTQAHPNGTARIAEAADSLGLTHTDIIVNLQADEPFMPPSLLNQVAHLCAKQTIARMATLCHRITEYADIFNPNIVKVVMSEHEEALYFSRAPIPWDRAGFDALDFSTTSVDKHMTYPCYRHIGLYAYDVAFLKAYVSWPVTVLEQSEQLEQLRVLSYGYRIAIAEACEPSSIGIDTPADLAAARALV